MAASTQRSTLALAALALVAIQLLHSSGACDPSAAEMAVRMRMQAYLNMFPNIYDDIRQGRLVPNRYNNQNQYGQQQQGYIQPGQQQGTYIQPNQGYVPQQQGYVQPQGQMVVPQQQQVLPQGTVVVPQNGR